MSGSSFNDYVLEQLERFRGVALRRMFGGAGLFKAGVMFGLIASDELYFKVGATNQPDYVARKSKPFVYSARSKTVTLPYWRVPDDVLEDPEMLASWASKSHALALAGRKAQAKPRRKVRRKPARR